MALHCKTGIQSGAFCAYNALGLALYGKEWNAVMFDRIRDAANLPRRMQVELSGYVGLGACEALLCAAINKGETITLAYMALLTRYTDHMRGIEHDLKSEQWHEEARQKREAEREKEAARKAASDAKIVAKFVGVLHSSDEGTPA